VPQSDTSCGVYVQEGNAGDPLGEHGTDSERFGPRFAEGPGVPPTPSPMHDATPLWPRLLAAVGLACLASTVFMRRRHEPLSLPERLGRCGDDLQRGLYA
jgi:hypothetical protein